ncbi:hypothetical protein SEA_NEOS5_60 [Mycobacterium phage Neos5]|uniref:Uncharacterized protein n=2 Tax=Pipefishvirus athena TaxID=1982916 RepID=A0A345MCP7_9CAUD|nr:hypothetical protein PBI_BALOO_60 [Mycobacterium phage Baloo]AVR55975.1 hypothetical protein SEA_YAHALOM_59 [Mycobacterium phage Yahalom]AXH48043.1 hypothetical protein SEA_MORTY007_60 [Mycobacterium phage Morty007]AXH68268.1 hypothetical protein SEA_TYDOLLA_58 [Mycobacterium phage Tydolla]AZF93862.1 hypothetical protein SEA_MARLEY1013_61 [Mycobacterium phage Marley1013]QYW01673.1 hypothetical protein SEA_NEOS5_60 [Mycobacterium phage Neos5]UDG78918.1 hypothetical protein SEA_LESTYG_59 [My
MTISAVAEAYMTTSSACQNCSQPVNDQMTGAWIHTLTGLYRCSPSSQAPIEGDGYAAPFDAGVDEEEREKLFQEGESFGRSECEETHDDIEDDARRAGHDEGYAEAEQDVSQAVRSYLDEIAKSGVEIPEAIREHLAGIWDATELGR